MKEVCESCFWFKAEPQTNISTKSFLGFVYILKAIAKRGSLDGGSKPPIYGKCKAVFQDAGNQTQVYDFGTLSSDNCSAKDDTGYELFRVG